MCILVCNVISGEREECHSNLTAKAKNKKRKKEITVKTSPAGGSPDLPAMSGEPEHGGNKKVKKQKQQSQSMNEEGHVERKKHRIQEKLEKRREARRKRREKKRVRMQLSFIHIHIHIHSDVIFWTSGVLVDWHIAHKSQTNWPTWTPESRVPNMFIPDHWLSLLVVRLLLWSQHFVVVLQGESVTGRNWILYYCNELYSPIHRALPN